MKTDKKHYKFINSKTGNVIYHYTLKGNPGEDEVKIKMERIKAEVATKNTMFLDTIYWEEEKEG